MVEGEGRVMCSFKVRQLDVCYMYKKIGLWITFKEEYWGNYVNELFILSLKHLKIKE